MSSRITAAVLFVLAIVLPLTRGDPVTVNIHVKLDGGGEATAIGYDQWCHARLPSDDVWLATINQPHVTLYLTEFDDSNLQLLQDRLGEISEVLYRCYLWMNDTEPSGDYGMWNVINNQCLQSSSDVVVNATYDLAVPNQPVPDWVYKLPEPERSEKIEMIKLYGSPNVFSQFQPHVTLAYDNATADNFGVVFSELPSSPFTSISPMLGMGRVGNWGTVLRGKDYADWVLPAAS